MKNQSDENIPSYFSQNEEDSIDIKRYLSLFISNWYWFAVSLFISLGIAYSINRWSEKVYTVSSTMLIKDDKFGSASDLANIFPGTNAFRSQQNLKNEIGILKSYNLNYKVIQELPGFFVNYVQIGKRGIAETRLYKNCPFEVVYDSLNYQNIGHRVDIKILSEKTFLMKINDGLNIEKTLEFGQSFKEAGFNFRIVLKKDFRFDQSNSNKYYFYFVSPAVLANSYRSKLSVYPIDNEASLVTLTTTGLVPEQEADYLNKLMNVYLQFGLDIKNETASQTISFIENQLGTVSDSLRNAEKDLENFRLRYNLVDISNEGVIIQKKLESIDAERSNLVMQKDYYEYLKDYIGSKHESEDIIAPSIVGITDPLLIRLVGDYSQAQEQRVQMAMNLVGSSEPLKVVENGIEKIKRSILENINDGFLNIDGLLDANNKKLLEVEGEVKKLPSTERQMINIQRKFDINNTVYTFLLEKRAEAGIAKASNVPDNRIIDYAGAFSSYMIEPKTRKNLMMAFIIGLIIPLFSIIVLDLLNNKIIDKKDIENGTRVPVVGFISHNASKSELPVSTNPGSPLSESFRSIRTNLKYFVKDIKCPVISVSSTITAEGKTFISANMAAILAMSGKKVLLLGLDLRKPRTHKLFGMNNENGISRLLIGEAEYQEIIQKTEVENLWYAPAGPIPPNPAEMIESLAMTQFIERAKQNFDYIVIDTPPVAIVTDALLVSSYTDFYLFVVRQRYSSKNSLSLVEELYKNENIRQIGIVINDISVSGYYGYGLRYGYSVGYGYTYGYSYYGGYADSRYGYKDTSTSYYKENA
jgi:capsular exopolysaccharide synthesis family protein